MLKDVISPVLAVILVSSMLLCPYAREQFDHKIVGFSFTASPHNIDLSARAFSHLMTLADRRHEPIAVFSPDTLRINPDSQGGEFELSDEKITSFVNVVSDTQKGFLSPMSILGPIRWVLFLIRFIGRLFVDLVSIFEADYERHGTSTESSSPEYGDHHQIVDHHLDALTRYRELYNNLDTAGNDADFSREDVIDHGLIDYALLADRDPRDFFDTGGDDHPLAMIDHEDDFPGADLMSQHIDYARHEQIISVEQQGVGSFGGDWYNTSSQTMMFADSAEQFPEGQFLSAHASSVVLFEEDGDEDLWSALGP